MRFPDAVVGDRNAATLAGRCTLTGDGLALCSVLRIPAREAGRRCGAGLAVVRVRVGLSGRRTQLERMEASVLASRLCFLAARAEGE
jgi:hypothetical protein